MASESLVPYPFKVVPADLKPHENLSEFIDPKDFLNRSPLRNCTPEDLAEAILRYYFRRREGVRDVEVQTLSGGVQTIQQQTSVRFPLLSDVARVFGLTKNELLALGRQFPDSIGRALEAAMDVTDEHVVHGTLEGKFHPNAIGLIAPNVSRIKPKTSIEVEDKTKRIPMILDEIEKMTSPYASPSGAI